MINIFVGYDSKEKVAFNTLSYSILKNSTQPIAITPIPKIAFALLFARNDFISDFIPI